MTLRETTEWIETTQLGANYLLGSGTEKIVQTAEYIIENGEALEKKMREMPNPFGDGHASQKIINANKNSKLLQ